MCFFWSSTLPPIVSFCHVLPPTYPANIYKPPSPSLKRQGQFLSTTGTGPWSYLCGSEVVLKLFWLPETPRRLTHQLSTSLSSMPIFNGEHADGRTVQTPGFTMNLCVKLVSFFSDSKVWASYHRASAPSLDYGLGECLWDGSTVGGLFDSFSFVRTNTICPSQNCNLSG